GDGGPARGPVSRCRWPGTAVDAGLARCPGRRTAVPDRHRARAVRKHHGVSRHHRGRARRGVTGSEMTASFVSHLEGAIDGAPLEARRLHTLHAGRPIWVRYDLGRIGRHVDRDRMAAREASLWRYRELLP